MQSLAARSHRLQILLDQPVKWRQLANSVFPIIFTFFFGLQATTAFTAALLGVGTSNAFYSLAAGIVNIKSNG